MSAIRPAGSPEHNKIFKAEVKNGNLFINGLRHDVYLAGSNKPLKTPLIDAIAKEVNEKNIKPGHEIRFGEFTFVAKVKQAPTPAQAGKSEKTKEVAQQVFKPTPPPRKDLEKQATEAPTTTQENRPPMPAQAPLKPVIKPVPPPRKDKI